MLKQLLILIVLAVMAQTIKLRKKHLNYLDDFVYVIFLVI